MESGCANCVHCDVKFSAQGGRRYLRRSIGSVLTHNKTRFDVRTADALHNINTEALDGSFLCTDCYNLLGKVWQGKTAAAVNEKELLERKKRQHGSSPWSSPQTAPGKVRKVADTDVDGNLSDRFRGLMSPRSPGKMKTKPDFKHTAKQLLDRSSYKPLFRLLLRASKAARAALKEVVASMVNKEVTRYTKKKSSPLCQPATVSTIDKFRWQAVVEQMDTEMPFLTSVITAAGIRKSEDRALLLSGERVRKAETTLGAVLAIILYHRCPRLFKFLQSLNGVEMWRAGCSQTVFKCFQHLGWSIGVKGTRTLIDRLRKEGDQALREWKEKVQATLATLPRMFATSTESAESDSDSESDLNVALEWAEVAELVLGDAFSDFEESPKKEISETELQGESSDEDPVMPPLKRRHAPVISSDSEEDSDDGLLIPSDKEEEEEDPLPSGMRDSGQPREESVEALPTTSTSDIICPGPGWGFCYDNIQFESEAHKQGTEHRDRFVLKALAYGAQNRIDFTSLEVDNTTRPACSMPIATFLPGAREYQALRHRMIVIVMRVLVKQFDHFQMFYSDVPPEHVPHDHSVEMGKKSLLVNFGTINGNPSSAQGTAEIMKTLQELVPEVKDHRIFPIIVNADGLSNERMIQAKRNRAMGVTPKERFEGLEPVPAEFHKRGTVNLQDSMNELLCDKSAGDPGTLKHISNCFGHRHVKKTVLHCFNHAVDLLKFATYGMVSLLALKLLNMQSLADRPSDSTPESWSDEERVQYLTELAAKVVAEVWMATPLDDVAEVCRCAAEPDNNDDEEWQLCTDGCKEDTGELMVECSNNECPNGRWYHLSCVHMSEADVPEGDWWCSDDCRWHSIYCTCKSTKSGRVVECAQKGHCTQGQFFHWTCVGLNVEQEGLWYCSAKCRAQAARTPEDEPDYLREYSRTLVWHGLKDLAGHDGVREGDGEFMTQMWKIDMLGFWTRRHPKYLIFGHRLLSAISGWLPPRLAAEAEWNRTVNLCGGLGHNLGMDLVNEFLNNEFIKLLKSSHGRYTELHIQRASQLVGPLGKAVGAMYQTEVAQVFIPNSKSNPQSDAYAGDIKRFVELYKTALLFDDIPAREHSGFPKFLHSERIEKPEKLKAKLLGHSAKLDRGRSIQPNC